MVKDLRQICKDSPINATVFHPYFVFFDQFELVRPTSIQSMVIGAIIMMIVSFIFIPNFLCSLWVAFSIVSIELGVAGYMSLWDVNLDSISMINLIMCIGFSVDFTAHICYTYMSSKADHPDERVREALYSLGLPIVQGSFSTILGVIALLLADSYIFLVFFKMVFLVIFFGAMHGLFLLPVLLSLFGPGSCASFGGRRRKSADDEESDRKISALDKDRFTHPYCIPHPQLAIAGNGFGSKTFLGAPYKAYGDEKDLGIGTSGEDSSESSSSKSQRRQAIEDENTRRRYEEGWRRSSSHNLTTTTPSPQQSPSQFQPVLDLYGHDSERIWNGPKRYDYDDLKITPHHRKTHSYDVSERMSAERVPERERDRRKSDDNRRKQQPRYGSDDEDYNNYSNTLAKKFYYDNQYRKYSDDSTNSNKRNNNNNNNLNNLNITNEERRLRKYSPPEGIYKQNPNRSSSQHNLYYPRQPQRSVSQHSLKYSGDIRFP